MVIVLRLINGCGLICEFEDVYVGKLVVGGVGVVVGVLIGVVRG